MPPRRPMRGDPPGGYREALASRLHPRRTDAVGHSRETRQPHTRRSPLIRRDTDEPRNPICAADELMTRWVAEQGRLVRDVSIKIRVASKQPNWILAEKPREPGVAVPRPN